VLRGNEKKSVNMSERQNTVVCTFEPTSHRISAFEIHEWIHNKLRVPEHTVTMIQIDGPKRQIYIKLVDFACVQPLLQDTSGQSEYKHTNGEISIVHNEVAGMGTRRIRITNLPPEMAEETLRATLTPYGKIISIQEETLSRTYSYVVANGIRQVAMNLTKHIPSHMTIVGHRILTFYEGQPLTCYGCGEIGHMYQACPKKRGRVKVRLRKIQHILTSQHTAHDDSGRAKNEADGTAHTEQVSPSERPIVEAGEWDHTDCHPPVEGASDPNIEQDRPTTHTGECRHDSTGQKPVIGQETGNVMEEGEMITDYTPVLEREIPLNQKPQGEKKTKA